MFADEKCPAGLQHPVNLPETPGQVRPEIDGLKGCNGVKPVVRKHHIRHTALQNGAATLRDGGLVDLFRLLHADGRIVDALDDPLRAFFQQPPDIRTAAAAAVQPLGVRRSIQKLKPPPGHGAVPDIHHGDHNFPAKAHGLAGVFKE